MTSALAYPLVATSAASRPRAATALAVAVVSLSFLLSFLQYCLNRIDLVRLVPLAVLVGGTLLFLLASPPEQRKNIWAKLSSPRLLAVIALATLPTLVSSLYRNSPYPCEYGLAMIAVLLCGRVLLSGVGFAGLMQSFFYAATAGLLIVTGLTLSELFTAASGAQRYYPFYYEPNRIAFFAVTAIPAQCWMAWRGKSRLVLLVSAWCGLVTVAASSRGSTGALLIGAASIALLSLFRKTRGLRFALSSGKLATLLIMLLALTGFCAAKPSALPGAAEFLRNKLALDSKARGLDSGFTGRTNGWSTLIEVLPKTWWLAGNGYRTSDEDFDFSVDSGYLASAYEMGLFSTAVILLKYIFVLGGLASAYLTEARPASPVPFVIFTLAVFFANGFVHRVLFGYGDPASMLALFCFVSDRADAEGLGFASPV